MLQLARPPSPLVISLVTRRLLLHPSLLGATPTPSATLSILSAQPPPLPPSPRLRLPNQLLDRLNRPLDLLCRPSQLPQLVPELWVLQQVLLLHHERPMIRIATIPPNHTAIPLLARPNLRLFLSMLLLSRLLLLAPVPQELPALPASWLLAHHPLTMFTVCNWISTPLWKTSLDSTRERLCACFTSTTMDGLSVRALMAPSKELLHALAYRLVL